MKHVGTEGRVHFIITVTRNSEGDMVATADCIACAHRAAIEAISDCKPGDYVTIFERNGGYDCTIEAIEAAKHVNEVRNEPNYAELGGVTFIGTANREDVDEMLEKLLKSVGYGQNEGNLN